MSSGADHGSDTNELTPVAMGDRLIGIGYPVYVIAEAGNNHNGKLDLAIDLVDAAADAGCDAIKFQKRDVAELLSRAAFDARYDEPGRSFGSSYGQHREHVELSEDQFRQLHARATRRGLSFLASAWDEKSARFIESLAPVAHKIGSPDLTNHRLCRRIAGFGRPILLSTGMAERDEVVATVAAIRALNSQLILLHCVSIYPAPPDEVRLQRIGSLRVQHGLNVGYSSHDLGIHLSIAAAALGACLIEKHLTTDRTLPGSDHSISAEPDEFASLVKQIREVDAAMRNSDKPLLDAEVPFRRKLAKSVTTRVPISRGTVIRADMLTTKSPGTGISAARLESVVGSVAARDLPANETLNDDDTEELG